MLPQLPIGETNGHQNCSKTALRWNMKEIEKNSPASTWKKPEGPKNNGHSNRQKLRKKNFHVIAKWWDLSGDPRPNTSQTKTCLFHSTNKRKYTQLINVWMETYLTLLNKKMGVTELALIWQGPRGQTFTCKSLFENHICFYFWIIKHDRSEYLKNGFSNDLSRE